ncbi:MAG: hypothetical protein M1814_000164 [Vezdaea aestivalis]|nr:MAG: hypothetical protein M1814_000164 [Vezdaea aestivalis]
MDFEFPDNQACLVFSLRQAAPKSNSRSAKRRKVDHVPSTERREILSNRFVPLLGGAELESCIDLRHQLYTDLWSYQQERIDLLMLESNVKTLTNVVGFISQLQSSRMTESLRAGLISIGPSIASHGLLFKQLAGQIAVLPGTAYVLLTSADAPNIKSILKILIKGILANGKSRSDGYKSSTSNQRKLLDFDLKILQNYVEENQIDKVIVGFQDSEGFSGEVLNDLLGHLKSWLDRIPFTLLFGIATSIELFYERLPRATAQLLRGKEFIVQRHDKLLDRIFEHTIAGEKTLLRPGGSISGFLLDRQKAHVQSVQAFTNGLKYAYMSHFFANPLSFLAAGERSVGYLQAEHYEALRNLPSFRKHVENLVAQSEPSGLETARRLLVSGDDCFLTDYLKQYLPRFQTSISQLFDAMTVLNTARSTVLKSEELNQTQIYVEVASHLRDGPMDLVRDLLSNIKKTASDVIGTLLSKVSALALSSAPLAPEIADLKSELKILMDEHKTQSRPLRSAHDSQQTTVRTTIVGQKVGLVPKKAIVSSKDEEYTLLLQRLHKSLGDYFHTYLQNPTHFFLSEIFLYDLRAPHRASFMPKPRFALERALSSPHDYLGCDCCKEGSDLKLQPATAIVYQLYLEGGQLINIGDMWEQFRGVTMKEEDNEELKDEILALADLKFLGMIKPNRRKPDHVAKLAWRGL